MRNLGSRRVLVTPTAQLNSWYSISAWTSFYLYQFTGINPEFMLEKCARLVVCSLFAVSDTKK
jgi:hypothetical protein